MSDGVFDVIVGIVVVAFAVGMFAAVLALCLDDTETFKAIDEKIARAIRDDEDEF